MYFLYPTIISPRYETCFDPVEDTNQKLILSSTKEDKNAGSESTDFDEPAIVGELFHNPLFKGDRHSFQEKTAITGNQDGHIKSSGNQSGLEIKHNKKPCTRRQIILWIVIACLFFAGVVVGVILGRKSGSDRQESILVNCNAGFNGTINPAFKTPYYIGNY